VSVHTELVKKFYIAFSKADRDFVGSLLSANFTFSAPPDPLLDRKGFFKKCWPAAGTIHDYDFIRLIEHANERL
jgi:ketosteroid isomerase-like protein